MKVGSSTTNDNPLSFEETTNDDPQITVAEANEKLPDAEKHLADCLNQHQKYPDNEEITKETQDALDNVNKYRKVLGEDIEYTKVSDIPPPDKRADGTPPLTKEEAEKELPEDEKKYGDCLKKHQADPNDTKLTDATQKYLDKVNDDRRALGLDILYTTVSEVDKAYKTPGAA